MCVCFCSAFVLCVQIAALRRADPASEKSYRLCKRSRNCKSGQGPTKGSGTIDRQTEITSKINPTNKLSDVCLDLSRSLERKCNRSFVFWDITSCSPLSVNRRFGGTCRFHLALVTCFNPGFLVGLFLDPEDGGDVFSWNVCWLPTDYTALYPTS
jgi:hypothetical protein